MEASIYSSIIFAGILLKMRRYTIIHLIKIFFNYNIYNIYKYLVFSVRIIGRFNS